MRNTFPSNLDTPFTPCGKFSYGVPVWTPGSLLWKTGSSIPDTGVCGNSQWGWAVCASKNWFPLSVKVSMSPAAWHNRQGAASRAKLVKFLINIEGYGHSWAVPKLLVSWWQLLMSCGFVTYAHTRAHTHTKAITSHMGTPHNIHPLGVLSLMLWFLPAG